MAEFFFRHQLEYFFGPYDGNKVGQTNYKQSVEGGVGRRVIAAMLEGTENVGAIQQALETLPMTERRRRYEAEQAELARLKAEELRQKAVHPTRARERL